MLAIIGDARRCLELTFPLGTAAIRVDVGLDEADVALDDRADVPYPVLRALDVSVDRPGFEATQLPSLQKMRPLYQP